MDHITTGHNVSRRNLCDTVRHRKHYHRQYCRYTKVHNGNLHVMTLFEVTWQGQRSLEVKLLVIWRQIVIVMVALFQIAPAWTDSHRLQPNLDHRCTMGTFMLWRTSRSHDKVKGHWRSNCYSYLTSNCYSHGCPFSNCSCMNRFAPITTKLES